MKSVIRYLRSAAAVTAGYLLLAMTNMLFVIAWFVEPMAAWHPAAIGTLAAVYTLLCAVGTGYLVALIAGRRPGLHASIVVALMAAIIVLSIVLDVAAEPQWYKVLYLIVMVGGTLVGGRLGGRRLSESQEAPHS